VARGFMFALGRVQSRSCHTDRCPTGVATQNRSRQRALVVPDKAQRVVNYHRSTLHALGEPVGAAGLKHPAVGARGVRDVLADGLGAQLRSAEAGKRLMGMTGMRVTKKPLTPTPLPKGPDGRGDDFPFSLRGTRMFDSSRARQYCAS
jgi:hypothetical protein